LEEAKRESAFIAAATVVDIQQIEPLHVKMGPGGDIDYQVPQQLVTYKTLEAVRGDVPDQFSVVRVGFGPSVFAENEPDQRPGFEALVMATPTKREGYRHLASPEGVLPILANGRVDALQKTEVGRTLDGLTIAEVRAVVR
jgi:hypothetical protein